LYVITEPSSQQAALQTGQVDVLEAVNTASIPVLKSNPKIKLFASGPATAMRMAMWIDKPPFNDNRVREAMKKVIDRRAMVQTILGGYGTVGDDNLVAPSTPAAWRHSVPGPDIAGAKTLLRQAGYGPSNPLKLPDLYCSDVAPNVVNMCQLYKQQASAAGINVNVVLVPPSEYWVNYWLKQPFLISYWGKRPPAEALAVANRSTSPYPETHWKSLSYDAILDKANQTIDPNKRAAIYKQAGKILSLNDGALVPMFEEVVAGVRSNCTGYRPTTELARFDFRTVSCKR
jgi:peptide/nickel transport system substrate-binding protein